MFVDTSVWLCWICTLRTPLPVPFWLDAYGMHHHEQLPLTPSQKQTFTCGSSTILVLDDVRESVDLGGERDRLRTALGSEVDCTGETTTNREHRKIRRFGPRFVVKIYRGGAHCCANHGARGGRGWAAQTSKRAESLPPFCGRFYLPL